MEGKGGSLGLHQVTLQPSAIAFQSRPGFRPAPKRLASRLARRRPSTVASLAVHGAKWQRDFSRSQSSILDSSMLEIEQAKRQTPTSSPFYLRNRTIVSIVKLPNREMRRQLSRAAGRSVQDMQKPVERLEEPIVSFPPALPPVQLHTVEVKFRQKTTHLKAPIAVLLSLVQSRKGSHKPL